MVAKAVKNGSVGGLRSRLQGLNGDAKPEKPEKPEAPEAETSVAVALRFRRPERERALIVLEGTQPLVVHRWGEKARKELIDSNTGKGVKQRPGIREPRNPAQEYRESLYPMSDGKGYGFPAGAFKSAACSYVSRYCDGSNATYVRGLFWIEPDDPIENLVRILGPDGTPMKSAMREDIVRLGGIARSPTPRWRGMFTPPWYVVLRVICNDKRLLDSESVLAILEGSGPSVGVGEGRTEKKGNMMWGSYRVLGGADYHAFLKRAKVKV